MLEQRHGTRRLTLLTDGIMEQQLKSCFTTHFRFGLAPNKYECASIMLPNLSRNAIPGLNRLLGSAYEALYLTLHRQTRLTGEPGGAGSGLESMLCFFNIPAPVELNAIACCAKLLVIFRTQASDSIPLNHLERCKRLSGTLGSH